jgi:nucleoside-diphosphate-sugar epimerase
LVVAGLGYAGAAVAREAAAAGWRVAGTVRDPARAAPAPPGVEVVPFAEAGPAIAAATHLLATAAPGEDAGDPVLAAHGEAVRAAPDLRWIGYVSTTGVYGDRGGGWVDEKTPPAPAQARTRRRVAAEERWAAFADRLPCGPVPRGRHLRPRAAAPSTSCGGARRGAR